MNDQWFAGFGEQIVPTEAGLAATRTNSYLPAARQRGGVSLDNPFHRTTPSAHFDASRNFLDAQPAPPGQAGRRRSPISYQCRKVSRRMQVTIEKLVYGGAGLARTDQGVIFVPRTAPGDVVEVELVARKSDYATARVTSLLEPSPDRQTPSCPNYQTAGCCHWQHIQYARQLAIKEAILRETL